MPNNNVVSCDRDVRNLIVNVIKNQNEMFLKFIAAKLNLDQQDLIDKYLIPFYYMPIIEKRSICI
jgi:hypothetical protein